MRYAVDEIRLPIQSTMLESSKPQEKPPLAPLSNFNRSQDNINPLHGDTRAAAAQKESESSVPYANPAQIFMPAYLPLKSQERLRKSDLALRQRSQSAIQKENSSPIPKLPSSKLSTSSVQSNRNVESNIILQPVTPGQPCTNTDSNGSTVLQKTFPTDSKVSESEKSSPARPKDSTLQRESPKPYIPFPAIPEPQSTPVTEPAPATGMYWSTAPISGSPYTGLRAHTSTLIGSNIYIFGGCNSKCCFNDLSVLDADAFYLSSPHICGDVPAPLRAMTCTAVGKKLIVFGGGDGPAYYNDVYVLDTVNFRWSKPKVGGDRLPSKRRAHTACLWRNGIYIFGGGDGVRALNDVWRLDVTDVTKMTWKLISAPTLGSSVDKSKPKARGYHTANMVSNKLIIFGGSDGGECFQDVWIFDVETLIFSLVKTPISFPRLSHTATIVGSYLFVIGGHDGVEYSNDVLLLNLVTMVWDKRRIYGQPPQPRGYHGTVLHDSRLIITGGFDGREVFSDVKVLELAVHAYYSQISHFSIEV